MKTGPIKTGLIAGASLCALFTAAAGAQQPPARPLVGGHGNNVDAFVAQHDGNADARLTWAEFDAFRRQRYDATDANHDGTVDIDEYLQEFHDRLRQQAGQGRPEQLEQTRRRYAALDTDKDGRVTRAEFDASGERVWSEGSKAMAAKGGAKNLDTQKSGPKLDTQKDGGSASRAEKLDTQNSAPQNARNADTQKEVGPAPRADRATDRFALPSSHTADGFRTLFDGNDDGDVTRAEFDQARQSQFARTDTNGDGALSEDEYRVEFEDRLDRHVATLVRASDTQTRTRYGSLDTDKDGKMTFAEFQVSGKRTFDTNDRNHDGTVDAEDAKLPPPRSERASEDARTPAN